MRDIAGMSMENRLRWAGNTGQLYGVRSLTVEDGRAKGTAVWQVNTGGGLQLDVTPDCGMDVGALSYRGVNISFMCKNGPTSAYSFSPFEDNFLNTFSGGMLYTCGLMNVGPGNRDGGTWHPVHGRIHATGADQRSAVVDEQAGTIRLSGRLREAALFGHNLQLKRTITLPIGGSELVMEDEVTNLSPTPAEFMLLYHLNFGFPFLSDQLSLQAPSGTVTTPRTERAAEGMDEVFSFCEPEDEFAEQVYFHDIPAARGMASIRAINGELGIGAELQYSKDTLPVLVQWKSMQSGDYALGLEPSNSFIAGRSAERESGTLPVIWGFETVRTKVVLRLYDI